VGFAAIHIREHSEKQGTSVISAFTVAYIGAFGKYKTGDRPFFVELF